MIEIVYKEKTFNNTTLGALNGKKYLKVQTCPYCNIGTDAPGCESKVFSVDGGFIYSSSYKCTSCDKTFFVSYFREKDSDLFKPFSVYPNFQDKVFSDEITKISPRFVKLYNQAYKAEYDNNFELAGCGYRNALEVLIKDYVINVLNEKREDVAKKKLCKMIESYLNDVDMSNCADVVRILGNDNTHYERDYENIDFSVLKQYMNIFIQMIDVNIKTKNPPVSR